MTTQQIEESCICEIIMMIDGWKRRYYDLQDLFIMYSAMPVYQVNCKHPPKYEDFVRGRDDRKDLFSDLTIEDIKYLAEETP